MKLCMMGKHLFLWVNIYTKHTNPEVLLFIQIKLVKPISSLTELHLLVTQNCEKMGKSSIPVSLKSFFKQVIKLCPQFVSSFLKVTTCKSVLSAFHIILSPTSVHCVSTFSATSTFMILLLEYTLKRKTSEFGSCLYQ